MFSPLADQHRGSHSDVGAGCGAPNIMYGSAPQIGPQIRRRENVFAIGCHPDRRTSSLEAAAALRYAYHQLMSGNHPLIAGVIVPRWDEDEEG